MNRRIWLYGGVAAAAGLTGAGWSWWRSRAAPVAEDSGEAAAAINVWDLRFERPEGGEEVVVAALRGKPLLLNFWATWCPPCIKEMPLLDQFQRDHAAQGWQVLGLAVDSPTPVREYLARLPMGFAIGLAGVDGVDVSRSLGNRNGTLPFTVVFDKSGAVVQRKMGSVHPEDLLAWARDHS